MDYTIRKLEISDFEKVAKLHIETFGNHSTMEELVNKYSTDFTLFDFVCFGAFYGEELVSFYGSIPHFASLNTGEVVLIAQSSDAMTDKDHYRKGLFLKLATANFAECKKIGAKFIYGFPNQNSKPGFVKKMNWVFTDDLEVRILNVKRIPFDFIKRKVSLLGGIVDSFRKSVLNSKSIAPQQFKSLVQGGMNGVFKNIEYIKYKTRHKESFFIKVCDKIVWLKYTDMFLMIGDIEDVEYKEFEEVINKLKKLCWILGLPHIRFNVSANSKMLNFIDKICEPDNKSFAVGGLIFDEDYSLDQIKFTMADNDTF